MPGPGRGLGPRGFLTEEMVGDTIVGDASFAEYIKNCYKK